MSRRPRRNPIQPGDGDPRHGTYNGYSNHLCRCTPCREANALFVAAARRKRTDRGLPADDPRHGRETTYGNYGCRCRPCTDAASAAKYQRIQQNRKAAA